MPERKDLLQCLQCTVNPRCDIHYCKNLAQGLSVEQPTDCFDEGSHLLGTEGTVQADTKEQLVKVKLVQLMQVKLILQYNWNSKEIWYC